MNKRPTIVRFNEKYIETNGPLNTNCWLWTASVNNKGYGWIGNNGKVVLAHRFSYQYYIGQIPKGLDLDHLCRQRNCVNPNHLEPVTRKINANRGALKGKSWSLGEKSGTVKLTPEQAKSIFKDTRSQKEIASEYGIHQSQVSRIKSGERRCNATH